MNSAAETGYERLDATLAESVDEVCDRFEAAWREGRQPDIESLLQDVPAAARSVLVRELVLFEIDRRREAGQAPRLAEYRKRFPDLEPDWLARALSATDVPRRTPIANVGAASATPRERDLQILLRKRLLIAVAVIVGFFGALPLISVPQLLMPEFNTQSYVVLILQLSTTGVILALGAVMLRWPGLSLRALRGLELAIFAATIAVMVFASALLTQRSPLFQWAEGPDEALQQELQLPPGMWLDPLTIRWFALVVLYGTLIPNTWRRCAAVVGSMAAFYLVFLSLAPLLSGASAERFSVVVFYPFMWMGVACVIAIFGSYRLSVLQQEVYAARKLGQYQLKQLLGSGGMGEVYLAEHVLLKQACAVKVIRPERTGNPETLRRFEREVQATARLKHPNTIAIYDYGHTDDGTFYSVMEYLPGFNLHELVQRFGPLPPGRAVHLLRQVCGALREAHGIGLLHRDIKPANIILCERGGVPDVVKLLDFGLVKDIRPGETDPELTHEGTVAGTPAYMSPEQSSGQTPVDARSDIYSLGAVAYFLLTGQPPFAARSSVQVIAAHLYEAPRPLSELNPHVPADLAAIVLKCLAKDPCERISDAASLDSALAHCPAAGQWNQEEAAKWWSGDAVRAAAEVPA